MKNPNGYGTVYKLSGNRRRPYIARVPNGTDKKRDKRLFKTVGYFETCPEALIALAEYNKSPYDIDVEKITFAQVYEKWSAEKFGGISKSNVNGYKKSYEDSLPLQKIRMASIRLNHLENVMDNCGKNYPMRKRLRLLWKQLFTYSLEHDIIEKDYSAFVKLGENEDTDPIHEPFTRDEIKLLFESVGKILYVETILIMIYTGLRIGELLDIKSENVHILERYLRGGLKTEAGIDRSYTN